MKKSLATVVIPIYLEEPSELEQISLSQTLRVLHKYPITFMAPVGLNTSWYEDFCRGKATVFVERFSWKGYEAFCELMVDAVFYERFLPYEYMLICHMDAFVFRDELEKWCQLGYDYIGSVIFNNENPIFKLKPTWLRRMTGFTVPAYYGNGGFALKKISTFYHITSTFRSYIGLYHRVRKLRKRGFFDDLFLTQHFPKLMPSFKTPPKELAQQFSVEYVSWDDEQSLPFTNQNNDHLPFGVHGWVQFNREFWKPTIRRYGYQL